MPPPDEGHALDGIDVSRSDARHVLVAVGPKVGARLDDVVDIEANIDVFDVFIKGNRLNVARRWICSTPNRPFRALRENRRGFRLPKAWLGLLAIRSGNIPRLSPPNAPSRLPFEHFANGSVVKSSRARVMATMFASANWLTLLH